MLVLVLGITHSVVGGSFGEGGGVEPSGGGSSLAKPSLVGGGEGDRAQFGTLGMAAPAAQLAQDRGGCRGGVPWIRLDRARTEPRVVAGRDETVGNLGTAALGRPHTFAKTDEGSRS